jgi:hypothetical protein
VVIAHSIVLTFSEIEAYGLAESAPLERYLLVVLKNLGLIAVPTFLFLSGTFLVYATRGKDLLAAYKSIGFGLRFILIPYLIWSILFYLFIYWSNQDVFTLQGYMKNLLVGYPFHFVPILVFFYLLGPILVRLGERYPWQILLSVGLYQLFSANVLMPNTLGIVFPGWTYNLTLPVLRLTIAIWGIYFPLGVIYSLYSTRITLLIKKIWLFLLIAALAAFVLSVLSDLSFFKTPLPEILTPLFVILLFPLIPRESIPFVQGLEKLGKRAYGLYLTNLISLSVALAGIRMWGAWFLSRALLLVPFVILFTILAQWVLLRMLERLPFPGIQRYVFG